MSNRKVAFVVIVLACVVVGAVSGIVTELARMAAATGALKMSTPTTRKATP